MSGQMTRLNLTENMRRLRTESAREPIDHAYYAFMALTDTERLRLAERFNAAQKRFGKQQRLSFSEAVA